MGKLKTGTGREAGPYIALSDVSEKGSVGEKWRKKTRHKPRNCGNYPLTFFARCDTMIIHTVILCLFLDFTSNMVILAQITAAVKQEVMKI